MATTTSPNPYGLITPGILTVGSDTSFPPQEYIDDSTQQVTGFDIDLITAITQRMGLRLDIVTTKYDTIMTDLENQRFDVAMSALTITPDRLQNADFVPYFKVGESLLVQAGNPRGIRKLANLCGQQVGVQKDTVEQADLQTESDDCQRNGQPPIAINALKDQVDVIKLLASQHVVATYQDSPSSDYFNKLYPGQFAVEGPVVNIGLEGIAVHKGNLALLHALQSAFDALKAANTYHTLIVKWGMTNEEIALLDPRSHVCL